MTTPIRADLEVSLLKLQNALLKADQQTQKVDAAQAKVSARVQRVIDRIKLAQAEAAQLEAASARAVAKVGKVFGRAAGVAVAGSVLSEIGIPEAAAPLVQIGTAAFVGAQFAGPAGAAFGAAGGIVVQLIQAVKGLDRKQEQLQAAILEGRRKQADLEREIVRERLRKEERDRVERAERDEDLERKFRDRQYRSAMAAAMDAR